MTPKRYQTSTQPPGPLPALIRAIKLSLKPLAVGVFLFFGLFLIFQEAQALTGVPFVDSFNSYTKDIKLSGQGSWLGGSTTILVKDDANCLEDKCVEQTASGGSLYRTGIESTDGEIFLYFKLADRGSNNYWLIFQNSSGSSIATFQKLVNGDIYMLTMSNDKIGTATNNSTWYALNCQWKDLDEVVKANRQIRCQVDSGGFSAWRQIDSNVLNFGRISLQTFLVGDRIDYISDLVYVPVVCTDHLTMSACQSYLPTCCWGWSFQAQDFTCDWCPTTECTETPDPYSDCAFCGTEETCNAQGDHCYWWAGSCKYGSKTCGADLNLQFCLTDGECTTAGGYWYGDFCWVSPLMGLTSWSDYYDTYGDYETPSDWINDLATSVESFFGKVGGLIFSFSENFDVAEAMEQGEKLGSAIPKARAYLEIFNSFFGDFPIGEIFLFVLILMLCVGVFRLFRNLKFW
jgi:hypothetical protein